MHVSNLLSNHTMQDVCWSAQDMRQITGRVYRQPQNKTVQCIHLIAADTSDFVMYGMANGKKEMLEAFVNKSPQAGVF